MEKNKNGPILLQTILKYFNNSKREIKKRNQKEQVAFF